MLNDFFVAVLLSWLSVHEEYYRNLLPLQEFYFFILFHGILLIDLEDLLA